MLMKGGTRLDGLSWEDSMACCCWVEEWEQTRSEYRMSTESGEEKSRPGILT